MLNLPHIPTDSPSQPKSLTFTGILSLFEQIKQNPSDPLFSIASTEKEIKWVIIPEASCSVLLTFDGFFYLYVQWNTKLFAFLSLRWTDSVVFIIVLIYLKKNLNIELILHTRMIRTSRMHIVFYKTN